MKKQTVTGSLRKIINELGLIEKIRFSDTRKNNRVGVKFVGIFLTKDQQEIVKTKMQELGFEYHAFRVNNVIHPWRYDGTRCTFKKLI